MKKISSDNNSKYEHSKKCIAYEYGIDNECCSICRSVIAGRYPKQDYIVNKQVDEILYIVQGNGIIASDNQIIHFNANDVITIGKGEKFYFDAHAVVVAICTPPWYASQHIETK